MELTSWLNEYEKLIHYLRDTWPSSYISQPDGCYGWDNVAKYQAMNRAASQKREEAIREEALRLLKAWAETQETKREQTDKTEKEASNRCKYCETPIPLGQIWCAKCAAK